MRGQAYRDIHKKKPAAASLPLSRRLLLSVTFLVLLTGLSAKTYSQSIYFRHYQVENGLSNNTVFCSLLDRHGFLWLGTKDGLDCFNGYNFKEYRSGDSANDLKDSYIRSMYLDTTTARDILYIGTRIGVFKFDPLKESFEFILKTRSEVDGLVTDSAQKLWAIVGKSLICLDLKTNRLSAVPGADSLEATAICNTPDGSIWVATANGSLHKIIRKNSVSTVQLESHDIFAGAQHLSPKWIERIYSMHNGQILIGTSNYGAKLFDPETQTTKPLITFNSEHNGIFARDFKEVGDSALWIATESGIYIYNLRSGKYENLTQKTGDPYSLSDNAVYTLAVDKEGGVWAGTYSGGLNYVPHPYSNFKKYYSGQWGEGALYGNVVREICQDKYGSLWIGTEDGGLNELNPATGKIRHFMATGKPTDISYPNIHALLTYGDSLLIGTFEHGMDVLDLKTNKVIRHFPEKTVHPGEAPVLKSSFIVTLCRTAEGIIYVGTRLGLYRFYPHKNSAGNYFELLLPALAASFIHTLMVDSKDRIWIGTMGSGLYCYTPATAAVEKYIHQPGNEKTISNNWITTTFEDKQGRIWAGTEGGGLCLLLGEKPAVFKHYTMDEGLPGNTIYKILQDDNGLLWISTSRGLVRWDTNTDKKEIFTTANGLLSDQFNYNAGFKDQSGRLYFGCVKGLISFDPASFSLSDFTAPLYITSLQAEGQQIATWNDLLNNKLSEDSNRDRTPHYIEIPHKKSSLTIEFAALSYTAPEMIQYQYKLEGLDKNWTYLSSNRKAYFTNLSPGDYTFKVKSTNVSGKWNNQETLLYLRILPTFWESNLAIVLYTLLGIGIVLFLFRSYDDRIKEKNKRLVEHIAYVKEKELYEAKIDFFTHVTHEIKTPLTLIKAPLEKITKQIDQYPKLQKYIQMIQRNAARLIALSEQLLDFRKTEVTGYHLQIEEIDIKAVLTEMGQDFKALAKEKDLKFKMYLPGAPMHIHADRDALTKILTNLLDNATKYAAARLEAGLEFDDNDSNRLIFYTLNDGSLISEQDKERIFEPFLRLDTAKSSSGAGLGLSLCRTLATLHGGTLILDTSIPGLNKFVLSLPLR